MGLGACHLGEGTRPKDFEQQIADVQSQINEITGGRPYSEIYTAASAEDVSKLADLHKQKNELLDLKSAPPDMPFKGDAGKKYLFRQIIKHAVQEGYDSIGWTTGEQQAARYDLSKHVDEIIASTAPRLDAAGQYQIRATDKEGNQVINKIFYSDKEVEATFGKELASKITAHDDINNPLVISGTDLKVGGEGKKALYDVCSPNCSTS